MTLIELSIFLLTIAGAVVSAVIHDSLHVGIFLGIIIGAAGGFVFSYAVIGFVMLINGKPLFRRRRKEADDSA